MVAFATTACRCFDTRCWDCHSKQLLTHAGCLANGPIAMRTKGSPGSQIQKGSSPTTTKPGTLTASRNRMASSSPPQKSPPPSATFGSFQQTQKAIEAMQNRNKVPIPEIDFSLHAMEDGSQVSTLERVCKGVLHCVP
jgi:hypothetical protein